MIARDDWNERTERAELREYHERRAMRPGMDESFPSVGLGDDLAGEVREHQPFGRSNLQPGPRSRLMRKLTTGNGREIWEYKVWNKTHRRPMFVPLHSWMRKGGGKLWSAW